MIKTLYQFGQQLQKMDDMQSYFEIFGSPYSERAEGEKVIVAVINAKSFQGLEIDEYRKTWNSKYLFRELAAARSTSIVPTLHFYNIPQGENATAKTEKELDDSIEKFYDKISRSIEANSAIYEKYFDQKEFLKKVKTEIKDFSIKNLGEKKNYLFTFKIDNQWLGDIPDIKKILEDEAYNKYFSSKGEDFKALNKVCAVTYQPVEEVWGRVDTLGFTVNDIAFSRNGFESLNSYKMFPVSEEAVKVLEGTKRSLEDVISFGFQNLRFFVLPRFIAVEDENTRLNIVKKFVLKCRRKNVPLSAEAQNKVLVYSEEVFSEIVEDNELSKNSIYYDIFFYEQKQAQFSIKLHVSDVIPSRFKTILESKETIENYYQPITKIVTKKETYNFHLTFYELKKYFPEPFFFQIMEAIFYKNTIKEKRVLAVFMDIIITAFKNPSDDLFNINNFHQTVKKTFVIYQYFQKLKLFGDMENNENIPLSIVAQNFVEQHPNFFQNKPLKEAAFYLGCATEILLNAQESYLGNRPFKHKLNNLSIGYKELMLIKPKLINKTEEYEKAEKLYGDYPEFLQIIAKFDNTFTCGQETDADKTELSYAFSLGLTIQKEFFEKRKKERSIAKAQRLTTEKLKN